MEPDEWGRGGRGLLHLSAATLLREKKEAVFGFGSGGISAHLIFTLTLAVTPLSALRSIAGMPEGRESISM